ncbi:MAG: DNA lyase [Syntrophales bacterium]
MNIANIELAVRRICQEIHPSSSQSSWDSATEAELVYELVACILGSQVPYEIALTAAEEIRDAGLLENPTKRYSMFLYEKAIYDVLRQPLHGPGLAARGRRYRFARMRANHISRTVWAIYSDGGSLKGRLEACTSAKEARRSIVEIGVGIGPKQASLFLRNIGFTEELAILDTHLLRFMSLFGLLDQTTRSISSLQSYETHENHLRYYAKSTGYPLGCIDQAIWIVMRVCLQGARA